MKIGLVPLLYDEYNYGGVLQFFALQQTVRNLGYDINIIRFNNEEKIVEPKHTFRYRLGRMKGILYSQLHQKETRLLKASLLERKHKIDDFKNKFYANIVEEKSIDFKDYSAVICGSDQIWNPKWARKRNFLEFVPDDINKIIYAASLGVEKLSDCEKELFMPRLQRLNHVSVREYSALSILSEFSGRDDIIVVADPTLLLLPEQWEKLSQKGVSLKEKYVFTYFLGDYSKIKYYVAEFARAKNLKIVNIPFASGERTDNEHFGDVQVQNASPEDFLSLINGAEYVFTDSFHACIFSTLFKKEYYVFERDGSTQMIGRILTLFRNFNIPSRLVPIAPISELPKIDYSKNDVNQEIIRQISIKFLKESIKNG